VRYLIDNQVICLFRLQNVYSQIKQSRLKALSKTISQPPGMTPGTTRVSHVWLCGQFTSHTGVVKKIDCFFVRGQTIFFPQTKSLKKTRGTSRILSSPVHIFIYIYYPPGFLPSGHLGENVTHSDRDVPQRLIEICGFVDQGVVMCVWMTPLSIMLSLSLSNFCFSEETKI
jgi:hypothetical protein